MNHQASESVSGFGSLSETAHKKHKIFKKSHTPDVHLPMDARIQEREREVLKIRPPAELPEGFRTELNAQRETDHC
jgi:hypothetical protein